jgi:predicted GH43/DUF377 family glycosyl hydrolase
MNKLTVCMLLVALTLPQFLVSAQPAVPTPGMGALPGAWTKYTGNPVLDAGGSGAWNEAEVFDPWVLLDGSTYRMWFTGGDAAYTTQLGYASSADGIHWNPTATPVLTAGSGWEANSVRFATVIKDGATYKMWYTGGDGSTSQTGYATSPDGTSWTRYGSNPVLAHGAAGDFDGKYAGEPSVIKTGSGYLMWYAGRGASSGGFGLATSADGTTWTKYAGNPVLTPEASGDWDALIYAPKVVYDGSRYHMWYGSADPSNTICQTGYAVSSDGIQWTKRGIVLHEGQGSEMDSASADYPTVLLNGEIFQMWYSALDSSSNAKYRIAYATAPAMDRFIFLPNVER